jgi:NAD(P)-dependent dehydrogenase (short-subunit alcohol dehydrogenase family)
MGHDEAPWALALAELKQKPRQRRGLRDYSKKFGLSDPGFGNARNHRLGAMFLLLLLTRDEMEHVRKCSDELWKGQGWAIKPPGRSSFAAAANSSLISFARALAVELAPIRVNSLVPATLSVSMAVTCCNETGRRVMTPWASG